MKYVAPFLILGLQLLITNEAKDYSNWKLIEVTPTSLKDVKVLLQMESERVLFLNGVSKTLGSSSTILTDSQDMLKANLANAGIRSEILSHNIQELINREVVNKDGIINGQLSWDRYYNLTDIYTWMDELAERHSKFVKTFSIGTTYEGREMKAIVISKSGETKPAIWVDSLIHSREWIAGAVGTYVIDQLLNNDDEEIQNWLDNYDFYFLPVWNADGYHYTHTEARFWRKTRSPNEGSSCIGTDPNRNFDYDWGGAGSSNHPCAEDYSGKGIFSEVETAAVRDFISSISDRLDFYLSLHSAGQYILIPYGDSNAKIPQYKTYMRIGQAAADAHARRNGTIFKPGNVVDLLYTASGISMDWVKDKYHTPLVLTYELRYIAAGLLPSDEIYDSVVEFFAGFRVLMQEVIKGIPEKDP